MSFSGIPTTIVAVFWVDLDGVLPLRTPSLFPGRRAPAPGSWMSHRGPSSRSEIRPVLADTSRNPRRAMLIP
jgi:hypothetical protein